MSSDCPIGQFIVRARAQNAEPSPATLGVYTSEMSRSRRPEDWERDLQAARSGEAQLLSILLADPRLNDVQDHTRSFEKLDYSFSYLSEPVWLDLKEKIRPSSASLGGLWPEVARRDIFVIDETVYRRIVWQGGGGYLVVHDHPGERWVVFGPWELTLGPRRRFARRVQRTAETLKGKILLDLTTGVPSEQFSLDVVLGVVERTRKWRDQIQPVEISNYPVPKAGSPG